MIGRVTVITGPMYSSKTYELIKRVKRKQVQGIPTMVYHPDIFGVKVQSRDGPSLDSRPIKIDFTRDEWLSEWTDFIDPYYKGTKTILVVIEEAHFFNLDLTKAIDFCRRNYRVDFIISGLTRSYTGEGFGCFPELLVLADEIISLKAICAKCKSEDATWTVRTDGSKELVKIGSDGYEARCVKCI